jgi:hypothetical protein
VEGSGYFMLSGGQKQREGKMALKQGQMLVPKQKMGYGINRNPLF